jgi:hypothetical protein
MTALTLRNVKGSALTWTELDDNFIALNASITTLSSANAAPFWNKARADAVDIYDLTIGDSTGDALNEWVYVGKVAYYCAQLPTYTVKYRTFSRSTGWGAYSTVQTGTGSNTVWVDNASVAGASPASFIGDTELLLFNSLTQYDNIDISLGQNFATSPVATTKAVIEVFVAFVGRIRKFQPGAGIFLLLPSTDLASAGSIQKTKNVVAGLSATAALLGCGIVDVYNAYLALGNAAYLYIDTIHPSAAGTAVYSATWETAHADPGTVLQSGGGVWVSPYDNVRQLVIDNCDFSTWPDGQAAPTGWTFTNCTPTKDATKAGLGKYAVRVTNDAANALITRSLAALIPEVRGRTIALDAEMWIPAGFNKDLTGRLYITSTNGLTSVSAVGNAIPAGSGEGYWINQTLTLTPQFDATTLVVGLFAGPSDTSDVGEYFWIRSMTVCYGLLPAPVYDASQPDGVIGSASGLSSAISLPLRGAMNVDGTPAAAGSGQMSVVMSGGTPPTALYLKGASAQGNTKTDNSWWEFVVPSDYRSTQNLTATVNAEVVTGSGTLGTALMTVYALEKAAAGTIGPNLIASPTSVIGTTNLFTYSEDFSNAVYSQANLTLTPGQTDPFGGTGMTKLETTSTANTTLYQTKTVNDSYATASVYVRKGSGATTLNTFVLYNATTATDLVIATLNYDTGVFSLSAGTGTITVEAVGNSWRIGMTAAITSGNSIRAYFGSAGPSVAAGLFFYAYGAQLQAGQTVGPYVATTSTTASSGAAADYNFAITGTNLVAGDVLVIGAQSAIQETGGINPIYGRINNVKIS